MTERLYYRFGYNLGSRQNRPPRFSQNRDGDAAIAIGDRLHDLGFRYGGLIINYPVPHGAPVNGSSARRPFDVSRLRPDDLILVTTRPPVHDGYLPDRRGSRRSHTALEERLFDGPIKTHFERLARSEVLLTSRTAGVSEAVAARQAIEFRQNGGATYQSYGSPITGVWRRFERSDRLTAAFLVYAEHAWPGGPGLLAAFGMGGTDTLVWSHLLATRYANLLCTTSFAMAEMCTGDWPEQPESMDFVDDIEVEMLGVAPSRPCRAA